MRIWLLGLLSVAFLWTLDYLTGYEISFSIFYLLPVALVAWYAGRQDGILISIAAAVSWLLAELPAGSSYSHPAIPREWQQRIFDKYVHVKARATWGGLSVVGWD